ncbi:MAG: AAA family ATPase [Phycisphaerales bacterium]|nr:AAA family ATPase [Phycisphaerales bacterium]
MKLERFRIQMYKSILDSGWVKVTHLTVLVGKNEAGKTSLLRALHKFNPFKPDPYSIPREWPRGHRGERAGTQVVCTTEFSLEQAEIEGLAALTTQPVTVTTLQITRDYGGRLEVLFPTDMFPDKLHPNDIDAICETLPAIPEDVDPTFKEAAKECRQEAVRLASEGRFTDLTTLWNKHSPSLQPRSSNNPHRQNEQNFVNGYGNQLKQIASQLASAPSIHKKAHEYVVKCIPTFVYMDEYRSFRGTALLEQVKQRVDSGKPTEDDQTLITIMTLAELKLDEEVKKATASDREERQYDLSDAAATLNRKIEAHWRQLRYEVDFRADGQQFLTFVKGLKDRALIRLEERSRGFQWFFSFDLMLMHETQGQLKGCVILLDEPGLHLHPEAQSDLLERLETYAEGNTLIYTTHLPFMIDLQEPDRIKVISETDKGTVVSEDLTTSQPEAKLVLQAALGIKGRLSYLVAERNLVVEGVDDHRIITHLSNLLLRSGEAGLPEDLFITPCGGASEATYIATFMIGQALDVVALYDTDGSGNTAKDKLVKNWLTRYQSRQAGTLSLGPAVGENDREFAIEDLFPETYYLKHVQNFYAKQLASANITTISLPPGEQVVKRVEAFFEQHGLKFNKGSVCKMICTEIRNMKTIADLPTETQTYAKLLVKAITESLPKA